MRNKFLVLGATSLLGSLASAQVVLDQLPTSSSNTSNAIASQDFSAGGSFPNHDIGVVDNFSVSASETNITLVEAYMQGWGGFDLASEWSLVTSFRVEFYTSLAAASSNLTGDAGSATIANGATTITNLGWDATSSHITIPVNVVLPGAGTYWVGVIGVLDEGTDIKQVGVKDNTVVTGGANANAVNPDGGWGLPGNVIDLQMDAAYRVTATPVPEPASMIALGLGAAAIAARRRRKKA